MEPPNHGYTYHKKLPKRVAKPGYGNEAFMELEGHKPGGTPGPGPEHQAGSSTLYQDEDDKQNVGTVM